MTPAWCIWNYSVRLKKNQIKSCMDKQIFSILHLFFYRQGLKYTRGHKNKKTTSQIKTNIQISLCHKTVLSRNGSSGVESWAFRLNWSFVRTGRELLKRWVNLSASVCILWQRGCTETARGLLKVFTCQRFQQWCPGRRLRCPQIPGPERRRCSRHLWGHRSDLHPHSRRRSTNLHTPQRGGGA